MSEYALIANPGTRRARLFEEALRAEVPGAILTVIPWIDVVRERIDLVRALPDACVLRIESAGQNLQVEEALLTAGYEDCAAEARSELLAPNDVASRSLEHGRIHAPRQLFHGFVRALQRVERALLARPDVRSMSTPAAIRELFDKRVTSALYERAQIPVPPRIDGIASVSELVSEMRGRSISSTFVKVATSSSASCLAVVRQRAGRLTAISTVQTIGTARYNSRRLSTYGGRAAARLVDFLLGEGSIIEHHVPKARLPVSGLRAGHNFDLRVLVVAGEPAFVVGRASPHPITNLHLGGTRLDEATARSSVSDEAWDHAMKDAARAGRCHDALHVGVDLAFVARGKGHVVLEANAFGDHLNGVSRDGLDPHRFELRAFARSVTSSDRAARSSSPSPNTR